MRRLLSIVIPTALLLTACGGQASTPEPTSQTSGDISKLDSLKLTDQGDKKAPKVEFKTPLEVTQPTIKVVKEGSGDKVKANQVADVSLLALSGKDASVLEDTYPDETKTQKVDLSDEMKSGNSVVYNAFVGAKIGSELAYAVPGTATSTQAAGPTQILVIKILSAKDSPKPLEKPEGDTVTPPAGLPKVTSDAKGVPSIDVKGVAKPTKLIAQDLIKGKGAVVKDTDTIVANYRGVNLSDGVTFDSSFERGQTASFALNQVIKGWSQGLAGKTVGSRVLLVVPKDLAYGDTAQGKAKGDLVFVVDILGVK
ncbi:FKBP-type peptidyl-prolyl cis-trans isomerase [Pseudarthrobacter sp. J1738]|uniref:FKBP-type peptidyl-prolyl cis-trans isomerase n=1 Tax=unclassified Pseudarthrobacter TaxID=2647000 RepID=UPI003D28CF5A